MFRIIRGSDVERVERRSRAVVRYTEVITAHPHDHVTLIEGDELPGVPPKVIAERFGSPPPTPDEPQYVGP